MDQLELMWKRGYRLLLIYAVQMVRRRDIAEDIVTDAFIKMHQADNIEGSGYSFLKKAVYHKCIDHLRHERILTRVHADIDQIVAEDPPEPDYNYMYAQYITRLYDYIKRLPEARGRVFRLSIEGHTSTEIACMLGISEQTVRNHKAKAQHQITEWVQKEKAPEGAGK